VFNGEIYNFKQLRAELESHGARFVSHSDTEVLLHGYRQWGDALVDRVDGMFAFAIWDGRSRRLLAARDRMGKKPFYWTVLPRREGRAARFLFASEPKAFFAVPGFVPVVSRAALAQYLAFDAVPPPLTIYEGVHKLDAGDALTLEGDAAAPRVRRYWEIPFVDDKPRRSLDDAASELWRSFVGAVERRLVSDVPLGIFLSGGIDSSAVAAAAVSIVGDGRAVQTFSMGFWDPTYDETDAARAVARHLGTNHHEAQLGPNDLLGALADVGRFLDEPLADASILPTYLLSKFAREHVAVALGGDGGDELFEGYPTFFADTAGEVFAHAPQPLRAALTRATKLMPAGTGYMSLNFKLGQFLRGGGDGTPARMHQRWIGAFVPEEVAAIARDAGGDPLAIVDARWTASPARSRRDRLMDYYARFYLGGDVNVKVDRASGAVGLEVRAPFLDTQVVSLAAGFDPRLRRRGRENKVVLKRAVADKLPANILARKKQGFGVPVARWLREELAPRVRDELAGDKISREGFFDPAEVSRLCSEHLEGRQDHRKRLWSLLTFERWWDVWGRPGASAAEALRTAA
jgi:asparagine synthase (glutamine-hydrolysing)